MIEQVRGFAFPFRIDPNTGGVAVASGSEKIRQNVRIILATRIGERPMLRDFGSRLPSLVHDPNDDVLADIAQNHSRQALLQWEPRIVVTGAQVEQNEGELRLRLTYIHTTEPLADQMLLPLT
jgi:phage baseplate assembly protein W